MTNKGLNLQDVFLNQARKDRLPLTIFLTNGYQIKGVIRGYDNYVIMIETDGKSPTAAINAYVKGLYHQMIVTAIDENPQLRKFNGLLFRKQIEKYKTDTRRFQELSKAELYARLVGRIPSAATA